ncbi:MULTISPECIES: DUF5953 family protein [unclassified Corallococcus]|uniref:DUF5953 family protein n=1 Tax=unclassified Corallococcus TaxID=2685029 RepID=UPI001A8F44B3|nr:MULTISPECIES: DUF5953 family protein [unclassified Corallococcus]MBN9684433.1 hypothetical protein [Corallococcus sp. NCSPR001]WAS84090.1 DUF5953 family protein [Corallococcus sp. NCRR]
MTTRKRLTVITYAPALSGKDRRALSVVHGMEKAFPGLRLEWEVGEGGHPIALSQRDTWLVEKIEDGGFPVVCNGDESYPVTVWGMESSRRSSAGGQAQFEVHAKLPLDGPVIAAAAALLEAVAEGARSFWGHASPYGYGSEVAQQFRRSADAPEFSPRGLPMLNLPEKCPRPETPSFLGWLNYWSAAAAEVIGFPDPARDAELLSRARRTPSGGWLVQLTETPLDYDNPVHLNALKQAYERFPAIGARSAPLP